MSLEEQVASLQAEIAQIKLKTDLIKRVQSEDDGVHGSVPGLMFLSRVGVLTEYWMLKPFGQGASLSVGTAIDRFAGYFEVDEATCPDHPSVAVFASVTCANPFNQPNHGVESAVSNAAVTRGLVMSFVDKILIFRAEGMELQGPWSSFLLGKIGGYIKNLWT